MTAGTGGEPGPRAGAEPGPAAGDGRARAGRFPWVLLRVRRAGGGRAVGVFRVWRLAEIVTIWVWALRPVRPEGLLLYRVKRHRGQEVDLADGTTVRPGDPVLELHVDNQALKRLGYRTWDLMAAARGDIEALAGRVGRDELGDVVAVEAEGLLGPAGRRLGFEVRPASPTIRHRLDRFFMVGLDALYSPDGSRRVERASGRWPAQIWMSRERLLRHRQERAGAGGTGMPVGA